MTQYGLGQETGEWTAKKIEKKGEREKEKREVLERRWVLSRKKTTLQKREKRRKERQQERQAENSVNIARDLDARKG